MKTYFAAALVDRGEIVARTLGQSITTLESSGKQLNETAGETSQSPDTVSSDPF